MQMWFPKTKLSWIFSEKGKLVQAWSQVPMPNLKVVRISLKRIILLRQTLVMTTLFSKTRRISTRICRNRVRSKYWVSIISRSTDSKPSASKKLPRVPQHRMTRLLIKMTFKLICLLVLLKTWIKSRLTGWKSVEGEKCQKQLNVAVEVM